MKQVFSVKDIHDRLLYYWLDELKLNSVGELEPVNPRAVSFKLIADTVVDRVEVGFPKTLCYWRFNGGTVRAGSTFQISNIKVIGEINKMIQGVR